MNLLLIAGLILLLVWIVGTIAFIVGYRHSSRSSR